MYEKIIFFAALIMIAAACKKDSAPARVTEKSSISDLTNDSNDRGVDAYIKIGTQKWMTTNLAVSHYRNGDRIPQVKDSATWKTLTTGAWCWYNNDSVTGAVYGKLYNWYAVNDPKRIAPHWLARTQ